MYDDVGDAEARLGEVLLGFMKVAAWCFLFAGVIAYAARMRNGVAWLGCRWGGVLLVLALLGWSAVRANAQGMVEAGGDGALAAQLKSPKNFERVADAALLAMRRRAKELNVTGVAVVAYFEGDRIGAWSSKMLVVGKLKDLPTATDKGSNLLGIAYAKAAEMADTLKDSGSQVRPAMTGEFGWQGGAIARGRRGYLIAAFSGGKSEDDVKVSQAGVARLKADW